MFFVPKGNIKLVAYFFDDATVEDNPEDNKGMIAAGYEIKGVLDTGIPDDIVSTCHQYYYFKSQLNPEDVHEILDILDHPVKTKVKNMESLN